VHAVSAAVIPVRKGSAGMVQKDGKRPNGYIPWRGDCVDVNVIELEMWANAHRDGRPAKYTWSLCSTPQRLANAH